MPHSNGYRARTRYMFAKSFRQHGAPNVSTYLTTFKRGDFVDIVANGSIHKGMPHRNFHGKTGKVWNVTPRALGVIVNKQIRNKIVEKKIHVRIEHVRASKCRQDFLTRMAENNRLRAAAQKAGKKYVPLKRTPTLPVAGFFVNSAKTEIQTVAPLKYEELL